MPRACSARPSIETAICSPEASSRSISRPRGDGETSRAIAISWSVVLPIADTATTTCAERFRASPMRPATASTFSGVATELPPYFWTSTSSNSASTRFMRSPRREAPAYQVSNSLNARPSATGRATPSATTSDVL